MELQKAIITEFRLKKVTWRSLYIRIKHLQIFVSAWFLVWTSQGLNLGPPDYESVALTNWATSPTFQKNLFGNALQK